MMRLGTDPEVFLWDNSLKSVISPALLEEWGIIKMEGEMPHPTILEGDFFRWHMDGVAAELEISPSNSGEEFTKKLEIAKGGLEKFVANLGPQYEVLIRPVAKIKTGLYKPYLDNPRIFQGFIFGCDPDRDAFGIQSGGGNFNSTYRYGGGHLHFSSEIFYQNPILATKWLAILVGNFCLYKSPFPKEEKIRFKVFGKPGRYRVQEYSNGERGIEYRSPSNSIFFLGSKDVDQIFLYARIVEELVEKGVEPPSSLVGETLANFAGGPPYRLINWE